MGRKYSALVLFNHFVDLAEITILCPAIILVKFTICVPQDRHKGVR